MLRKSWFLVVILALVLVASLSAQTKTSGFIGGLNFAKFSGDDVDDFEDSDYADCEVNSKIGLHLGYYMTFPINSNFGIRGEAALSMNGAKWEAEDDSDNSSTYTDNIVLLQVPVSGIYTFNLPTMAFKPFVGAGLSLGYPIYGKWSSEMDSDGDTDEDDGEYDGKEGPELSGPVLGYQINLGAEYNKYTFELRFEKSMTPVFDENSMDESFYSNAKLLVGYRFN